MTGTVEALKSLEQVINLDREIRGQIETGLKTPTYGPYLREMVRFGAEKVAAGVLNPDSTELALSISALLFTFADRDYRQGANPLSGEALLKHQANVLAGKIELVPVESATTEEDGIKQVEGANSVFQHLSSDVQATAAAINYGAFFREQTMASATRTLDRREIGKLLEELDSSTQAMPHLSVSNWAIGQTVAGIYRYAASLPAGRLRIFDIGSGHGATIAAITSSINNVDDGIDQRPQLAVTGLEATPEFYKELTGFVRRDEGIASLNLRPVTDGAITEISRYGTLTTISGDALSSLQESDLSNGVQDSDITVVTANYSWHRLPRYTKARMIRLFQDLPNTVFIIGDLAQNTSVINKRYFNLGVNGPLNCGNRGLHNLFLGFEYWKVNLEKEQPASLDPRIAKRILRDDKQNDGHLWIAHSGRLTHDALNLVPVA